MIRENIISEKDGQRLLEQLTEWHALEIQTDTEGRTAMIPYVMNDAVECYLRFEECTIHGSFDGGDADFSFVENRSSENRSAENEPAKGLIVRHTSGNIMSIWYKRMVQVTQCCQYHLIGHDWRRSAGQEAIRRLVNLICVIHDKITYLGESYCSEVEKEIAALAEFPPVLYYTPINESIMDWYPESQDGIDAAKQLAVRSENMSLYNALLVYETAFKKGKIRPKHVSIIAENLASSECLDFWRILYEKMEAASLMYDVRDYGAAGNCKIEEMREQTEARYKKLGYTGKYPFLERRAEGPCQQRSCGEEAPQLQYRGNTVSEKIFFVEEQPFTVMESEGFRYRIFSMTFPGDSLDCVWKEESSWEMPSL